MDRDEIVALKDFNAIRLARRSLPELVFAIRIFHDASVAERLRYLYLAPLRDRRSLRL